MGKKKAVKRQKGKVRMTPEGDVIVTGAMPGGEPYKVRVESSQRKRGSYRLNGDGREFVLALIEAFEDGRKRQKSERTKPQARNLKRL